MIKIPKSLLACQLLEYLQVILFFVFGIFMTIKGQEDAQAIGSVYIFIILFLFFEFLSTCRVLCLISEMKRKSKVIEDMRFSVKSEGVYDGG